MPGRRIALRAAALVLGAAALAPAAADPASPALVAVVIDDLGDVRESGLRAIELPGPVTYAVLPHTPHGARLARLAHALDKEVIVHLPMEARTPRALGNGGLTATLARTEFEARAGAALDSVPHAVGASNHMGSRLTAMPRQMGWLMSMIAARRGWMFLDSRTTAETVAERSARDAGVAVTRRDVFLDNEPADAAIEERLDALIALARRDGSAVAIGHAYPQTLAVLERELPRLSARGVRLVPLSTVVARRSERMAEAAPQSSSSTRPTTTR